MQALFVDFRALLVGRLGFLGITRKDLGIDLFSEEKILPDEYLFTLISKA